MNRLLVTLFSLTLLVVASSCQGQSGAQVLNVNAFETKLNATPEKIILDVRTTSEYNRGHLKNAVLVDYYQRDFSAQLGKLDKTKPVFVYCASGVRSNSAARELVKLGFKEVYDLSGGLSAWARAGKPIEK
ncbi:MAG: rhodanese-like domain-containing protein [Flammeovirgaceae bacterium]|nr:MAG: rhodanese-like domain-containing protein [Flammeovirgaceae bacterium]